jgi:hypothetical protein
LFFNEKKNEHLYLVKPLRKNGTKHIFKLTVCLTGEPGLKTVTKNVCSVTSDRKQTYVLE